MLMHGARPLRTTRRLSNLTQALPRWYGITNSAADGEPTLISIYDEIGMLGTSAQSFMDEVRAIKGDIELHVNSPGGDVFDGIAIYNTLRQAQQRGTVHVIIDGLAASAASFIAQAASPGQLEMAPHSQLMIHDGFALCVGNAADLRETADLLDKASDNIASIYAGRTGKPAAYWREKMKSEAWLSDEEAVAEGLADRIQGSDGAKPGDWDLSVYAAARKPRKGKKGAGKKPRYDPDHDGDDDSSAAGDTDHDYVEPDGSPGPKAKPKKKGRKRQQPMGDRADLPIRAAAAEVDNSTWDGPAAMSAASKSDDPAAAFRAICAGRRSGPADEEKSYALPHHKHPGAAPNADGVRNALSRLPGTHGLTNSEAARSHLEAHMHAISPDHKPGDEIDPALLMHAFGIGLEGARNG